MIALVSFIGTVSAWGFRRMVSAIDQTNAAMQTIVQDIGTINVSMGKTEMWMEMHDKSDTSKFSALEDDQQKQWNVIEKLRPGPGLSGRATGG